MECVWWGCKLRFYCCYQWSALCKCVLRLWFWGFTVAITDQSLGWMNWEAVILRFYCCYHWSVSRVSDLKRIKYEVLLLLSCISLLCVCIIIDILLITCNIVSLDYNYVLFMLMPLSYFVNIFCVELSQFLLWLQNQIRQLIWY